MVHNAYGYKSVTLGRSTQQYRIRQVQDAAEKLAIIKQ